MYTDLPFVEADWAERTIGDLTAFADEHEDEFRAATRAGRFPRDLYEEMGRRGWVGSITPTDQGGSGGGPAEYCLIAEEVGRRGLVSPQISVQGQRWLLVWGTPEQQERWLPDMASGRLVFSESISEPDVGSSFKNMSATARRDGDDWILNGSKTHVNLGADCDVTIFYAVGEEGLTSFMVDMTEPGIRTRQTDPIGLRLIPTADVEFDDVRVPSANLIGAPGEGLRTFLSTFNLSRLGNASELIGFGRRALVLGTDYANQRKVGDSLVTDFQGLQWMLADAYSGLLAASMARDRAVVAVDAEEGAGFATSVAKKLAIDAAEHAGQEVFALVGGHGLYHEEDYLQILADIKVLRIAGGSIEILRNHIAKSLLKDEALGGLR
jgi:alkylation response protein AidB-like acyl-CoA dehydrogenase